MLDLHTLEKTVNWLQARKAQIENSKNATANFEAPTQIKLLEDLIYELARKTHDIETAIEAGGEMGHLIPEKQTNTRHDYKCPTCGGKRSLIRLYFSEAHVVLLKKIFKHCVENKTHNIKTTDIKDLSHSDYSCIAKLQRFGFLYFPEGSQKKKKNGQWGVAVKRIYQFLQGEWKVAAYSQKDTVTKEQSVSEERVDIHHIKRRGIYRTDNGILPYYVEYKKQEISGIW